MGPSSLSIRTVKGPEVSGITAGASVGASVGVWVAAGEGGSVAAGAPHADRSRLMNTRPVKRKYNLCFILSPPIDLFNDTQDYRFCIYMFGAKIQNFASQGLFSDDHYVDRMGGGNFTSYKALMETLPIFCFKQAETKTG
jgi:hypothetical protein